MFRQPTPAPEIFLSKSKEGPTKQERGGGGRCRAFVSYCASLPEYRLDNGQLSFTKIMARYKLELQNPDSELMRQMSERGEAATRAAQASRSRAAQAGISQTQQQRKLSAFGKVNPVTLFESDKAKQARDLHLQWSAASRSEGHVGTRDIQPLANSTLSDFMHQHLQLESRLADHKSVISKVCKLASAEEAFKEKQTQDQLREFLTKPTTVLDKQLQDIGFPNHVQMPAAPLPSGHGIELRPQFDCQAFTSRGWARVRKKHGGAQLIEKWWEQSSRLQPESEIEHLPEVHPSFKPTLCFSHGYGECLCRGTGKVLNLARKALGRAVCRLGPKKTMERGFLVSGWLLVRFTGSEAMFHIAICYLRPQRPTFIKGKTGAELWHGYNVFQPNVTDSDHWEAKIDIDALKTMNLDEPSTMEVFKFIVLNERAEMDREWSPSGVLTYEPFSGAVGEGAISWWQGAQKELELEQEKQRKEAEKLLRKKKEGSGRTRSGCAPKKKVRRDYQRARDDDDVLALQDGKVNSDEEDSDINHAADDDSDNNEECNVDVDEAVAAAAMTSDENLSDEDYKECDVGRLFQDSEESEEFPDELFDDPPADVHSGGSVVVAPIDDDVVEALPTPDAPLHGGSSAFASVGHIAASQRRQAGKWLEGRSDECPTDCSLRKYAPRSKAGYHCFWEAKLPKGVVDSHGKHSHSKTVRGHVTDEEAVSECLLWLMTHA